jgi:hypothetical protein
MKVALVAAVAGALACALPICSPAITTSTLTLVYYFTYDSRQNIAARDSDTPIESVDTELEELNGAPKGTGASEYTGDLNDKGTITVNVIGQESDGGLVVKISEQGETIRRASEATCVVYSNTNVLCDPSKTVYTEEYTLLRFLGPKFVDPSQIGADKQWSFSQRKPDETIAAKYALDSDANGAMQIAETRTIKATGAGHLETDVTAKIDYDFNRSLPTSINEYTQQYTDAGIRGEQRTIYQTTLKLQSDSMANQ